MSENKKRVYIYPMVSAVDLEVKHPYIFNLSNALKDKFTICNYGRKTKAGIFDMYRYLGKTDIVYLNWIEDIGRGKLSYIQLFFFIVFIFMAKISGIKIIWTHHNVKSHYESSWMNVFLTKFLIKNVDKIVIHTKQSKKYISEQYWGKMIYFFHPITDLSKEIKKNKEVKYDILIWGGIRRSKGIEVFLKHLYTNPNYRNIKVKIVGKINEDKLKKEIKSFLTPNILLEDRFVEDDELQLLHSEAKFVLFPYTGESVLNSGVVVKSLPLKTRIIGPDKGAFKDLADLGLIDVYKEFSDILTILQKNVKKKM
ncbi:glycosyltransferase [Polaribacter sejongensis]|uniref:hypothetical protein n=1 Tax=Polaribacter sejongensis TaxID=985043 RepID=UPI0035A5DD19